MTISAATDQCAFVAAGLVGSLLYENLNTGGVHHCNPLDVGNSRIDGVIENDMYTAQIGTTATFTGSEWFIEAIGADIGILVPEIGLVYVPDVEDTWVDNNPLVGVAPGNPGAYIGPRQYQNTGCQGSDLPLGALLELDAKSSKKCRPNDWSAGLVVLANVSYNNAFDTGFVVTPQIAVSYDFTGTTPAPYGNYVEDRIAVNLGVSGTLNNNFRIGVNYVNYFGAGVRNKAQDQDYVSASASYSF